MIIFMLGQIGGFDKGPDQILGVGHYIAGGGGLLCLGEGHFVFIVTLGGGAFFRKDFEATIFLAYKYLPQVFKLTILFI